MEPTGMVVYEALRTLTGPVVSLFNRVRCEGQDNIPADGAAIIASNHRCYLDPLILAHCIPRFIHFAAWSYLFTVPGFGDFLRLPGLFPLNIYGGEKSHRDLAYANDLLSGGELVGIFPEGIESFMNVYQVSMIAPFKTGFVSLALDNRVPIIPVAIVPDEERELLRVPAAIVKRLVRHPKAAEGVQLITYHHVTCRIGRPIDLAPHYAETESKDLVDRIAGMVRKTIIRLYEGDEGSEEVLEL